MRVVLILALAVSISGCAFVCPLFEGSFIGMVCPVPEEPEPE